MAKDKERMKVHAGPAERRTDEGAFAPLVDIYETDDGATVIVAEVSGAQADAVDVRVDRGVLTISADADLPELPDEYARTYIGFIGGRFFRAFAMGDEVDRDRIEATLCDGVLTVRLPRAAAARTRKIEIKAG